MIEILHGYPDEVLAISGTGRVTERDYRDILIPEALATRVSTRRLHGLTSSSASAGGPSSDA
jgi:hypothetical protein